LPLDYQHTHLLISVSWSGLNSAIFHWVLAAVLIAFLLDSISAGCSSKEDHNLYNYTGQNSFSWYISHHLLHLILCS
jgi:hypothetical protein